MTPEEQQKLKINLQEIAEILYKNTPVDNLQSFESVELSVREHLIKGLAIKYNPSYARRVGNKKSDMSGCDLCDWDARNDLE